MAFAIIPDILLMIETVLFFGFSIFAFIRAYVITRNISYIHFIVGLFFSSVSYICANIPGYYSPEDNKMDTVVILIIVTNVLMALAFFLFSNSFIIIREDRLPFYAHIIALIIGATTIIISDIDESNITYDYTSSFWKVKYSSPLLIGIAAVGITIFLIYFTLYLIRKFQKFVNTKHFDISFVGFACLTIWMITFNASAMKLIRLFFFPLGMLFFGIAVFIDPLNFLSSIRIPQEIILLSRFDQPIIRYNFKEKRIDRNLEEIKMFIASGKMISESMNAYEKPKDFKLKTKEIKYIDLKGYQLITVGTKIDRNAVAALKTAFREFRKKTDLDYLGASTVLNDSDEKLLVEIFKKYLKRIDATKKKKV
jgi:hypothetical protein